MVLREPIMEGTGWGASLRNSVSAEIGNGLAWTGHRGAGALHRQRPGARETKETEEQGGHAGGKGAEQDCSQEAVGRPCRAGLGAGMALLQHQRQLWRLCSSVSRVTF